MRRALLKCPFSTGEVSGRWVELHAKKDGFTLNETMNSPKVFQNLQAARSLAALAVVAYHLDLLPFGQCGVDIFFVISGFIMSYVAPREGRDFLPKRLIRVLPLYWLSTIGIYVIATVKPSWLNTTTAGVAYLFKSLLFIPYIKDNGHWGPLNLNGWTLEYEMFFYLVIGLSMFVTRGGWITIVAASTLAVCSLFTALFEPHNLIVGYLGKPLLLEFCLGVLSYWVVQWTQLQRVSKPVLLLVATASLCVIPAWFYSHGAVDGFLRVLVYGVPSFVFITSILALEGQGWAVRSALIARLGAASYAIYLMHPYVVGVLKKLLHVSSALAPWQAAGLNIVVIVIVCVIADLCHTRVEKPMLARLNRWYWRRPSQSTRPA